MRSLCLQRSAVRSFGALALASVLASGLVACGAGSNAAPPPGAPSAGTAGATASPSAPSASTDAKLRAAIASTDRPTEEVARDKYRPRSRRSSSSA
jgi:hypothetical protein